MEFGIKQKLKNEIETIIGNGRKSVRVVKKIEKLFLWIGIVGGPLYIVLNILIPGISEVRIRGITQKNYFWIFLFGTIIVGCSLCTWIILFFLRKNLEGTNINERIDEELVIKDRCLMYAYRIKYNSLPSERAVFAIFLDKAKKIEFYQKERKLIFYGKIANEYVDTAKQTETTPIDEAEEREMIMYDYFTPSLISALEKFQINIKYI